MRCTTDEFSDLKMKYLDLSYSGVFMLLIFQLALGGCQKSKKIFYINSYHQGYGSSDDVLEGIKEVSDGKAELNIFFMDTKRNSDPDFIKRKTDEALADIDAFNPDVIIASDDNAVKYIIEPYFKNRGIPVVFCGVNWSADQYGLPTNTVTGMLEVLPIKETVEVVRARFPDTMKLTVLSENTTSEQKNKEVMQPLFDDLGLQVTYTLVDTFAEWKVGFLDANDNSDLVYIPTNGAVKNWDEIQAKAFVEKNITKPVITCDDFMMPYAVFGLTKVAKEQGIWAAETALKILSGVNPSDIPITKNSQTQAWLNEHLAAKINFQLPEELKMNCKIINK
jgi:ABC-type uncharacterized transport system substrate-binding protein